MNYSLPFLNSRNAQLMLLSKSFHLRQNFSEDISTVDFLFSGTFCSEKLEGDLVSISRHVYNNWVFYLIRNDIGTILWSQNDLFRDLLLDNLF